MKISLAPLQGFTDFPYRNAMNKMIGGIDKFYTPYLRFENDGTLKRKYITDILPENNQGINVVPQILVNNTNQFLELATIVQNYGYTEVNLNLGCPYPMVANKKLGAGLLPFPEEIDNLLHEVFSKTSLKISIKTRSGYSSNNEILNLINIFKKYPVYELIYHPRIGKQLYKGEADLNLFREIQHLWDKEITYNGDIDTIEKLMELQKLFPKVNHWMIGRGLLKNPFLAAGIKQGKPVLLETRRNLINNFHNHVYSHYEKSLFGDSHLLNKLNHFWDYFSYLFEDRNRVFKKIKKSKRIIDYNSVVTDIFTSQKLVSF